MWVNLYSVPNTLYSSPYITGEMAGCDGSGMKDMRSDTTFSGKMQRGDASWETVAQNDVIKTDLEEIVYGDVIDCNYRNVFDFVDHFMVTGAASAVRRIRILPMNQYT
jgi:hypothetical protein